VVRERGRIVEEMLRPDDPGSMLGEPDPALAGLWTGYRQALASGAARLVGKGTIYGHRVDWLEFTFPSGPGATSRVAVDRDSYRPIAFRQFGNEGHSRLEHVLLARREPFAKSDFRRLTPLPGAFKTSSSGAIPGHRVELAKPWLTAGASVRGLSLSVVPVTVKAGTRTSHGVKLYYGSRSGLNWIQIDEARTPPDRSWLAIPAGFVRVLPTEVRSYNGATYEVWMGALAANGIYVAIQTTLDRDGVLSVARALKPV
jgi:hypothetical protein